MKKDRGKLLALLILSAALGLGASVRNGIRIDVVDGGANAYADYPNKAVPVSGDLLLAEDSAAGGAKVNIDLSTLLGGGPVWTQGTGEVYTGVANDDVVSNSGTGLIGQSDDRWDIGYFEELRTSDNDGGSVKLHGSGVGGNLNITLDQTSGSYLHWLKGIFTAKDSFSSTNREMGVVVAGMNILINSKEDNGGASTGAIRLANITTMAGATDKIITVENPTDTVKAYVGFDGDWWSATGEFRSGAVSGGTGFLFNTDATFSAGDIFAVQNNGTEAFSIEDDNNIHIWGSIDSEVLDGGIAYDFNPINTFTSGTIFRFLNNSVITFKQEYTGRLALKMTDASGVVKIRAGESGDRHAFQLEATLNDGEAGNGAFILAHTGTTLATSGDDLLKVKNNTATMLNLDYLGNTVVAGYIDSRGFKSTIATSQHEVFALGIHSYLALSDNSLTADGQTVVPPDGTDDAETFLTVKKIDGTTMYTTIDPPGSDEIDGQLAIQLISQNQFITFGGDGTDWWITAQLLGHSVTDSLDSTQTTNSGTFVDIPGLTATVILQKKGEVHVDLSFTAETSGAASATGAWAVQINGVDTGEVRRFLSGTNDTGTGSIDAEASGLSAGTYTVNGRFRKESGGGVIQMPAGLSHMHVEAKPN